ncbi:MAG: hypothetical protein UR69_C0002G0061 [Candidatus Moranbacteria bacterium GW2011_GWE2_35_2-]|nr:MAG: hypothetical protein UR69_C0002G0061 [Candidatus Moranbacteria bacterium GW2011_GWE2_35_2-]KKQ04013.1 MAG: hypothetical protein US15_C0071G0004 [Candidatus Moranbacteria bacterium GW2011_GWF1_36_4]KKQ22590.1 MAG: hypothetical protein US37_C0002G0215 [Candidatus Moranbacteria bacterium GW2011_GWF2_37_11]KKQ28993.1 MAG: hypothetical protein US44_C0004G0037 [Candidatus Moranbacteria bacterium GW2011_GWD1_37_17]KKQ30471.1 MAG: hypothetical protein US47_C0002G0061 [Candidatus Moranbacteria b
MTEKRQFIMRLFSANDTGREIYNCKCVFAIMDKVIQSIYLGMENELFFKISELDEEVQARAIDVINKN